MPRRWLSGSSASQAAMSVCDTSPDRYSIIDPVRYTVVLGAPRSGTSLLMGVLDAMPDTECVQGNLLPPSIPQIAAHDLPHPIRDALVSAFSMAIQDHLSSGVYWSRSAAIRKWVAAQDGVREVARTLRGERSAERFIYKEPFFSFAPWYPYEALPEARLVYLVRDGRDVADSLVRTYDVLTDEKLAALSTNEAPLGRQYDDRYVPWWVEDGTEQDFLSATPFVRAIWMWREMVRRCQAFFSQAEVSSSGRVFVVRYEELVREPLVTGTAVAEHIGGPLTRRMTKRLLTAHDRSIGIHRQRDAGQVRAAERVAGSELASLGYSDAKRRVDRDRASALVAV